MPPTDPRPSRWMPARLCRIGTRSLAAMLALAMSGCSEPPPALVVADVGFTEEELLGLTPSRRAMLADLTALALVVDRGAVEALAAPLLRRQSGDHLWQRLQVEEVLEAQQVEEEVLRARYSANPEVELTVRHLIVLSPRYEGVAARAEARSKAERALERIRGGEPFPEVAAEVSEEPGAEGRQGLLEPGRQGAWVDEFWNAASALEVGEISAVVETQYGFHVLRLEGREVVAFEEVRDRVALEVASMITALGDDAGQAPLPGGYRTAAGLDTLADESADAATFEGGSVTLGDLLDYAATLDPDAWDAVASGTVGAREEVAAQVARHAAIQQRAAEAGIRVDSLWRSPRVEDWQGRVQQWAGVLGFRPGTGPEAAKTAALAALSTTGQMPQVTRDEVRTIHGLLERWADKGAEASD